MSDVELVVGSIPLGVTEDGWKVLKEEKEKAIPHLQNLKFGCQIVKQI